MPLSTIAREAGVGQGVLYRHFPDRLTLAFDVFAENFAELDHLAATDTSPGCFQALWRRLVAYTIESSAFVDMVVHARREIPDSVGTERLDSLLDAPLRRAQKAGLADPAWTPADVAVLLHMVYGAAITEVDKTQVAVKVNRALELIDPRLTLPPESRGSDVSAEL